MSILRCEKCQKSIDTDLEEMTSDESGNYCEPCWDVLDAERMDHGRELAAEHGRELLAKAQDEGDDEKSDRIVTVLERLSPFPDVCQSRQRCAGLKRCPRNPSCNE